LETQAGSRFVQINDLELPEKNAGTNALAYFAATSLSDKKV
jgi:hypothetical protein